MLTIDCLGVCCYDSSMGKVHSPGRRKVGRSHPVPPVLEVAPMSDHITAADEPMYNKNNELFSSNRIMPRQHFQDLQNSIL